VLEADHAVIGVLEIGPGLARVGKGGLGELRAQRLGFGSAQGRDMVWCELLIGRLAEAGDGAQAVWESALLVTLRAPRRKDMSSSMPRAAPVRHPACRGAFIRAW